MGKPCASGVRLLGPKELRKTQGLSVNWRSGEEEHARQLRPRPRQFLRIFVPEVISGVLRGVLTASFSIRAGLARLAWTPIRQATPFAASHGEANHS